MVQRSMTHSWAQDALGASGLVNPGTHLAKFEDLSPNLGYSAVVRMAVDGPIGPSISRSVIMKAPSWRTESLVAPADPGVKTRELSLVRHRMGEKLKPPLCMPRCFATTLHDGIELLWFEDLSGAFNRAWDFALAQRAVAALAVLQEIDEQWLTDRPDTHIMPHRPYLDYAHHIDAAHTHLDDPRSAAVIAPDLIVPLHRCLDALPRIQGMMNDQPHCFLHGDFQLRNLGVEADEVVAIDWAASGWGPAGHDLACFTSVYNVFGGKEADDVQAFETGLLETYVRALAPWRRIELSALKMAVGCFHASWGLHLRLGPALYVLMNGFIQDSAERRQTRNDINEGVIRALTFMKRTWPKIVE